MKPVWLVAAVVLAVVLVRRRRRLAGPVLVGGALAAAAMAVYGTGRVALPELDVVLRDLGAALGPWTYLLVAVVAFLEAAAFLGLLVPGETTVVVGGVVAGQGEIDIVALIAVAWAAAFAGDLAGYALGRRLGRPFLYTYGPRFRLTADRTRAVEKVFDRHGGKTVFVGRFVGVVRSLSPFLAGASRMPLSRFVPYDVVGSGIQTTILCLVGYVFWRSIDQVISIAKQGTLALSLTIVTVVGLVVAVRWLRVADNQARVSGWLDAHRDRLLVRLVLAVGRRARRPARFAGDRLTPGGLGLELTTLLAVASVAGYLFAGYLIVLDDAGGPTPGDRRALGVAARLGTGPLEDAAAVLAALGSLPVVAAAVVLVSTWLVVRRERLEAAVLLASLAVVVVAVRVTQSSVVRVAVGEDGPGAYPLEGAACAASWVAVAVALRRALPHWTHAALLVGVAVGLVAAIGLALVLRADGWPSDVTGGLALGLLVHAGAGMGALLLGDRVESRRWARALAPTP